MEQRRSMTEEQRQAAVALFATGHGRNTVAAALGVSPSAVRALEHRWRIRGAEALVTKPTKRTFSGEFKLAVVQRCLAGETKIALAQEFELSSPQLIAKWLRVYRAEGADGLRSHPSGRPQQGLAAPESEAREVARLRRENERLRAEVAYLGKLQALMAPKRP
jgi:transposase